MRASRSRHALDGARVSRQPPGAQGRPELQGAARLAAHRGPSQPRNAQGSAGVAVTAGSETAAGAEDSAAACDAVECDAEGPVSRPGAGVENTRGARKNAATRRAPAMTAASTIPSRERGGEEGAACASCGA